MSETTTEPASSIRRVVCASLVLAPVPLTSLAQLRVEITGVGSQQFPISIANFARNGQAGPAEIDSILSADL